MRYHGWRFPYDVYYKEDDSGGVRVFWSGGASVRFTPGPDGSFVAPAGVDDQLTSPQPGQYVLTTCADLVYYFDSTRHRRVARIEAPNGQSLVMTYNAVNQLTNILDSYGRQIQLDYDTDGYLLRVTDPNLTPARTVSYGYDGAGNLTAVTDPLGHTTTYTYDDDHRLMKITDPQGNTLQIAYNSAGDVTSLVTDLSARYFSYDKEHLKTAVIDVITAEESRRTIYRYDNRGRIVEVTWPDGLTRAIVWDDDDNPVRVTDESGEVTAYQYDTKGNVTRITDPLSRTVTFTYHPVFNEMTSATDALGRTMTVKYDTLGNVVRVTRPGNRITTYEYDAQGWHLLAVTDPLSRTTRYGYDQFGNNTVITDATGAVQTFAYDAAGRMLSYTDANGHTTAYAYDAVGHGIANTDPLTRTTGFAYDTANMWSHGNLQRVTDAAGNVRTYAYDRLNRLHKITDGLGGSITYTDDSVGNTTAVADAYGHSVQYTYDVNGRMISEIDPVGQETVIQYNTLGQVERRQNPDGAVSTYDYDAAAQLSVEGHPDGEITYAYDLAGNVVAITSTQAILHYAYNEVDEITNVAIGLPGLGISKQISYTYYADGSRATMTDPDGGRTTYTYDDAGRVRTITNPAGEVVTYSWDLADRLVRKDLGNGTYVIYGYDQANQLLSTVHHRAGGEVLTAVTYTYDSLGNRTSETHEDGRAVTYTYDARSRLVGARYSDGTEIQYTYDLAGHRTRIQIDEVTTEYTTDAAGRLQSDGDATYLWDGQGNLSAIIEAGGITTYTFDSRHRLTGVLSPTGEATAFALYPDGRRLSRADPDGTVTVYLYDGDNLLMELDSDGQTLARYTSGDMDDWLSMERDGVRYTYHADALGSTLGLSDGSGNLVEHYRYSPFGQTQILDGAGNPQATSAMHNPFRFTGRQALGLGGLYDYRARIYDPALGRFLSEDPVDAARDPNRYAYALNNPVTFIDPTGEDTWVGKGSGAGGGFLLGCKRWEGVVKNINTGEKCAVTETCCSLGAQAFLESEIGRKRFSGPSEGKKLGTSKWTVELGISGKVLGLSAGANLSINTGTGETYAKAGVGAVLSASGSVSTRGNHTVEATAKAGIGFSSVKGQWCRRTVKWCKKEDEDDEEKEEEDDTCDSDTGCCRIGPDCDSDPDGETECCFTCCDGPCDPPDCDPPPCIEPPCDPPPGPLPPSPGGDHPDENNSAASPQAVSSGSPIDRNQPYVGLLWRGYARSAGAMINQAGELYEPVGLTFSPKLAHRVPVLVIPSGGLYGLENSASLRTRLAGYVERGGMVISFDQQRGSHFGVLPAPASGDPLAGYGWREDNSCFSSAFYISTYHPVLAGFDKPTLDVHVDGYFTTLPSGADELLNRMKNGQPGLILYPYPASSPTGDSEGGWVMATTLYDDWGTTHFQGSRDALTLVRDMLSWAFNPDETLSEYDPGDAVSLPITVTNGTSRDATRVELTVLRPDRTIAFTQTVSVTVTAGGTAAPMLTVNLPAQPQLGIWWVEYTLRDEAERVLQQRSVGRRFVVSDPSSITGPDRPLSLSITAPAERYVEGAQGEFTFHVFNHSDITRTVTVRYGLPHHTWYTGDPSYGNFHDLHHAMPVGPNTEASFVYTPTLVTIDRLWASLYEAGQLRDKAHFAIFPTPPSAHITLQTHETLYQAGESVGVATILQNLAAATYDVESTLQVLNPDRIVLYQTSFANTLTARGSASTTVTFTLPTSPSRGIYWVQAETYYGQQRIAAGTTRFQVPTTGARITPIEPAAYAPGAGNEISFYLENVGLTAINTGTLTVTLKDPIGAQVWNDSQGFALAQGQTLTLTLPLSFTNRFGTHLLSYQASYDGRVTSDSLDIPFTNVVELDFDQSHYRARETIWVDVHVTNSGRFEENLALVRLQAPAAAYSRTHTLGVLSPGQAAIASHTMTLPITLTAGSQPLTVTLGLDSGSQVQSTFAFSVPPSELAISASPAATAGQTHTLTVTNVGGEATGAIYDLNLRAGASTQTVTGTLVNLWAGDSAAITIPVPGGTTSGPYYVLGSFIDTQTAQVIPVRERVDISGVDALLDSQTEQRIYVSVGPITVSATMTNTGVSLSDANLSWQVRALTGSEEWITHARGDRGPLSDQIMAIAVDGTGYKWVGTKDRGVSVMDDGGTPLDKSDDVWQPFHHGDGLTDNDVTDIAIDGAGNKWFATMYDNWGGGVSVLDDGGTPFDKSDDTWEWFGTGHGLTHYDVYAVAIDGAGNKWFATRRDVWGNGVSVLDDGGTPFDKSDDTWERFGTGDGLTGDGTTYSLAIAGSGLKWFASWGGGVSVLDDGGTPLDKSDDTWQSYTTADGLADNDIPAIATQVSGTLTLKWFGTYGGGVSVLDDGGTPLDKSDDTWQIFTIADGLAENNVRAIAVDDSGRKWFGTYAGGASVLDDGGTPFDKTDDIWQSFTPADGLRGSYIRVITVDSGGYPWFGAYDDGGVSVLDDHGTLLDKSDDTWQTTVDAAGLVGYDVRTVLVDEYGSGHMWFGAFHYGISVLDDGDSPFNKADDTWQSFTEDDGLCDDNVQSLTIDRAGRKWFGHDTCGVSVLDDGGTLFDKSDDAWQHFYKGQGLTSGWISTITEDGAGRKWLGGYAYWVGDSNCGVDVLDDGGTLFDKLDDTWQSFTTTDGLVENRSKAITIDGADRKWFGTRGGISVLDDGGTPFDKTDDTWQSFTTADGLASNDVTAVTVDGVGLKWIGTWGSGVSVLDDGGTPFDKSDDAWQTFTTADDDLANDDVQAIGVDDINRKWIATDGGVSVLDDGGTPFNTSDDVWRTITTAHGLASNEVRDIVIDDVGRKWFSTSEGVSVLGEASAVLWESDAPVNLAGVTQVVTGVGTLSHTGKLYLKAVLTSTTGQVVARDTYPFYVFPTQTALTLEADQPIYRPGQPLTLTGQVYNGAAQPLTSQVLTITQDSITIYTEGPFDVPAGGSHDFTTTTAAPDIPSITRFQASIDGVSVEDEVDVLLPQVEASVEGPALAGSDPFSLTVTLTNTGQIEAQVHVAIVTSETVTVPAGEMRLVQHTFQIAQDTAFAVSFTGDLTQTLTHTVLFGEAVGAAFIPEPRYCPGLREIPYTFTNTGQLPVDFTTQVTLTDGLTRSRAIATYLPISSTLQRNLLFDLAAGDYTLAWQHPFGAGQVGFDVSEADQATLQAVAGPAIASRAPVTVTVTDVGCNPFTGTVQVAGCKLQGARCEPFYSDEQAVDMAVASSGVYTFAFDTTGVMPGVYSATLTLLDRGRATLDTAVVTGAIAGPDLVVTAVPAQTTLNISQTVSLTFTVQNQGETGDQASLTFILGDLEDETQMRWLGVGESSLFTYTFYVPPDLTRGDYRATYAVTSALDPEGDAGDLTLHVEGISLTVKAATDQPYYLEGEPATVTLTITNEGALDTSDLTALVAFNNITQTQTFSLAPGASVSLDFPLTASFVSDRKVFYGVFYAGSDRSIHLNTLYLRQQQPAVTVLTNKQVYLPGESITATLITTLTQGTLTAYAPSYSTTLPIVSGAQFAFVLPETMARGSYAIYYITEDSGTPEDGRERVTPFDVDGPRVFVRSAILAQGGDTVTLDLTISSDRELDATLGSWLRYPDGSEGQVYTQTAHLAASLNNHVVVTAVVTDTQMGLHLLSYRLIQEGPAGEASLASGSLAFDVGSAVMNRVTTDRESYANPTDPVQALLEAYSQAEGFAQVLLTLDDGPTTTQAVSLSVGYQTLTVTLDGPIPAGERRLTVTLQTDGYWAARRTRFDYGTSLPDLYPGAPWVAGGGTTTRTLTALVSNEGQSTAAATTACFYACTEPCRSNGTPITGTLIGTASVSALNAASQTVASVVWDVQGQGGEHKLYVTVDESGVVSELDEENNAAQAGVTLPRLDSGLAVAPASIEAGEAVTLTARLENLQEATVLPVTATVEIRSPLGAVVYSHTWMLTLSGGEEQWLDDAWQSEADAEPGVHAVLQEVTDVYGEYALHNASFTIQTPLPCIAPANVGITGPTRAIVGALASFTATIGPPDAALPISYTWTASNLAPVSQTSGLSDTAGFTWDAPGQKAITVTARNAAGSVTATHAITISTSVVQHEIYLPLVLRQSP